MVVASAWIVKEDPVECSICCIDRDEFLGCKRCEGLTCNDCSANIFKINTVYPMVVFDCPHCRYKQSVDCLLWEQVDYLKLKPSILSKLVMLYKKRLEGHLDSDSDTD